VLIIRYQNPATVPVKDGDTVLLLPLALLNSGVTVSDIKVELEYGIRLTRDVKVTPGFDCVLLRLQN